MLAMDSPTLRYVFLQAPTARSLEAHTRCIAPLFSHDEVLPTTSNQRPYTQLKGLSLVVCESCHCPASVLEKTASIIHTQTSLEEIVLSGLDLKLHSSNLRMMIGALAKHLARRSFSVLYLSNMSIPFSILHLLTSAFFSADPTMRKQTFFSIVSRLKTRIDLHVAWHSTPAILSCPMPPLPSNTSRSITRGLALQSYTGFSTHNTSISYMCWTFMQLMWT